MAHGTLIKLTKQYSQTHYDRYVAQNVRAMTKARAKGHRDFANWSDAEIEDAAHQLARINNAGDVYVTSPQGAVS